MEMSMRFFTELESSPHGVKEPNLFKCESWGLTSGNFSVRTMHIFFPLEWMLYEMLKVRIHGQRVNQTFL